MAHRFVRSAFHILIVEDNLADAHLLAEIVKSVPRPIELDLVRDGV